MDWLGLGCVCVCISIVAQMIMHILRTYIPQAFSSILSMFLMQLNAETKISF